MPQNTVQERFIDLVHGLKLRFPVAMIARKTGYGKPTVSEYLKGTKEPSERFLRTFCEQYNVPYDQTFEEMKPQQEAQGGTTYIDQLLAAKDALLAEKDKRIEREQWFTDNVMANFARYDKEILDYKVWQQEVGRSILDLTKAVAPLLRKDQSKASQRQAAGK